MLDNVLFVVKIFPMEGKETFKAIMKAVVHDIEEICMYRCILVLKRTRK